MTKKTYDHELNNEKDMSGADLSDKINSSGKEYEYSKKKRVIGWLAVLISALIINLWTYWGIIENFHEGWYSVSLAENLFMLFIQYLLLTIVFCTLAVVSIKWPAAGLCLHIAAGLFFAWFFKGASFSVVGLMIVIPLIGIGLLYFFGRPEPKKWAYYAIIVLPLIIIISITPFKLYQVSHRINDGDFGMRIVPGNVVTLVWAPKGPGWPDGGVSYEQAVEICRYLSEDGTTIMDEEQNIWRLPSVDEAVRSMMLHNKNAGGIWDEKNKKATYEMTPDKETPLWDSHSKVIYYWTQTKYDDKRAFIIVYDGGVFKRYIDKQYGYLSFRAVKN